MSTPSEHDLKVLRDWHALEQHEVEDDVYASVDELDNDTFERSAGADDASLIDDQEAARRLVALGHLEKPPPGTRLYLDVDYWLTDLGRATLGLPPRPPRLPLARLSLDPDLAEPTAVVQLPGRHALRFPLRLGWQGDLLTLEGGGTLRAAQDWNAINPHQLTLSGADGAPIWQAALTDHAPRLWADLHVKVPFWPTRAVEFFAGDDDESVAVQTSGTLAGETWRFTVALDARGARPQMLAERFDSAARPVKMIDRPRASVTGPATLARLNTLLLELIHDARALPRVPRTR